jgi:tRNA C32,U32 (ribose-2'-O)-methylase TrmJ
MNVELVAWAAIAGVIAHAVGVYSYLSSRAKSRADLESTARDAKQRADEAHEKLAVLTANMSLHREMIARDYIAKDGMREVQMDFRAALQATEGRLAAAIKHQDGRLDDLFKSLGRNP